MLEVERGRMEEGLGHLRRALESAPETGDYWQSFAEGLLLAGRAQDAASVIEQAMAAGLRTQAALKLEARIRQALKASSDKAADLLADLFNQGRYDEAEALARRLANEHARDPLGWKLLGAVLAQTGRPQEAIPNLEQALALNPNDAETLNALGSALEDVGRLEEAGVSYARAVQQRPGFVAAIYNLARLMHSLGRLDEARTYFEWALTLDPGHVKSLNQLGSILREMGNIEEAEDLYRKALTIDPSDAQVLSNLGNTVLGQGRLDEALECQQRAVKLRPGSPEILSNLGNALQHLGRLDDALAIYQQAMTMRGAASGAENQADAIQQLEAMLQMEHPEILVIRGNTNQSLGRLDEAESDYRRAMRMDAKNASIYSKLLFTLNYHPDKSAEEIFSAYRAFDLHFGEPLRAAWQAHGNDRDPQRRLRIGYVSPDFRRHSSRFFVEPLLAHHDARVVEVTAYAELAHEDEVTARYRSHVDAWVPTRGLSDTALAERIRADGIDILVDLAGHTANNRLGVFARRPAPVSVSWMGYGYTTGLSAIDYFLADEVMVPRGSEALFAEQPWRLAVPSLVYRPAPDMGEVGPLPALTHGGVTFGTLTRSVRINHRTIEVWSKILERISASRLVVDSQDFASESVRRDLIERFAEHGIGAERLVIGYHSPPWDLLRGIDIGLDCFPHNSGTTLIESLYMGVPYVTLAGRPSVGRIGSQMLQGAGLGEWIADSEEEYVEKAVALSGDLDRLASIRAALRDRLESGPWRDEAGFARRVEQAYREMWQRWCG
ncbi:TPR domain protein, putative component of TonB system [Imhoffiella purpurea]|uniref:protein O-GlcNAc transferase n=1 Tax=Imhoffiella purpurea TaxID=1249627 RepID=W9VBJ7_9GAMM|nr:TPR domain protein, putative component of TonB system [Imhoffiella purpurea]